MILRIFAENNFSVPLWVRSVFLFTLLTLAGL